ncbi:MAG: amidophosphoribosyltransferase [Saprospiraceae bacterium]
MYTRAADSGWLKDNKPYTAELLLGHLGYGTHGKNIIETVHPFLRQHKWISRNLVLAGNFNLTNVDELFEELVSLKVRLSIEAEICVYNL